MNVDDVVAEKIAAAKARAEAAKRRRAAFAAARQRGLAHRHAQKLARLAAQETPASTAAEIARRHGYASAAVCQDCGTAENLHFGSWADPKTGESGDFLQCCACGLAAGDPPINHTDCSPITPKETI